MKILVVHQYYLLPGQPGGSRFNELARLWCEAGHQVTVIAGTVDYATGEAPERYRRRWLTREQDGQVTVYRCHVPASYGRSYLGRVWAFFGFTLSAASAALLTERLATSPPLVTPIPGWLAARLRLAGVPWISAGVVGTVNLILEQPFAKVDTACTLGHEATLRRGCALNPAANIAGGVDIGEGVLVGTGAQVLQYLKSGKGATVGAGAVVTRDVPEGVTVVGCPAKPLKKSPSQ